jgi:ribose transport system substrate-binding protein
LYFSDEVHDQTKQIYDFVHTKPAGSALIVESVVDEPLAPVARHAVLAGMGWYLLHRVVPYLDRLRREFPRIPIGSVTSDQREIGRIQGSHFMTLLGGRGVVLYVQGPAGSSIAADRLAGVRDAVGAKPIQLHLVRGDWSEQGGEAAVAQWLDQNTTRADLKLVGCQNDAMGAGAGRALGRAAIMHKLPQLDTLPVTGVDGNPDYGITLVTRRRLAATVVMPPAAGRAIEVVHEAWASGLIAPPIVQLPVHSYPDLALLAARVSRA